MDDVGCNMVAGGALAYVGSVSLLAQKNVFELSTLSCGYYSQDIHTFMAREGKFDGALETKNGTLFQTHAKWGAKEHQCILRHTKFSISDAVGAAA